MSEHLCFVLHKDRIHFVVYLTVLSPFRTSRRIRASMDGHNRVITADMERGAWAKLSHRDYSFKENKTNRNLLGELIILLAIE